MTESINDHVNFVSLDRERAMKASRCHWLSLEEQGEWDAFVAQHPLGLVYHLSSWQRVLETAFRHIRGRFLVLRNERGQIQAGLPLYTVSSWLLGNRIVSVPFATMCDPLISTKQELELLWPLIQDASEKLGSRKIEIRTRRISTDCVQGLLTAGVEYKHHYLPLGESTDVLFRSLDKTTIRQRVDQARRAGIVVEQRQDEEGLHALYSLLVATRQRRSLPPIPFAFFQAMCRFLGPARIALYLAMHEGEPVGGLLVLKFKDLWTAEYSGTSDSATRGCGPFLYWETIQCAKRSGAEYFSFGRTSLDNTGLLDHKRRWATIEEDLVDFGIGRGFTQAQGYGNSNAGILARCGTVVQLLQRNAPMVFRKYIGDFVYRHLG